MNKEGPIVIIDDDQDDRDLLEEVLKHLAYDNEVICFSDALTALEYLRRDTVHPFLILSDINMPKLDGFELKRRIETSTEFTRKAIPYVFFTTSTSPAGLHKYNAVSGQGLFLKPSSYLELVNVVRVIIEYWKVCTTPNNRCDHPDVDKKNSDN